MKQSKVHFTRSGKSSSRNQTKTYKTKRTLKLRGQKFGRGKKDDVTKNLNSIIIEKRNIGDKKDSIGSNSMNDVCLGEFTREVYNAICVRLGDTLHIPEDSVQALFNDMQLFPSKSQVSKMLQCARQCGKRNGATDYITFGEFCFLVREMQNQNHPKVQQQNNRNNGGAPPTTVTTHTTLQTPPTPPPTFKNNANKCSGRCEVFLGGSCNPTTWRTDTAIPELEKQGITFYNPQVKMWAPELVAQEYNAKQAASVLLFVIDSQTRSTVGMIEVAYLVASGRCVVVVAESYTRGQSIMGEPITDNEYSDLVDGQRTLLDLVKSKGVKIHTNLTTALQCTANILRNTSSNGMSTEEQITYKLRKLRDVYDSYGGDMKLYNVLEAYEKLTNKSLEISRLYNYLSPQNGNITNSSISFERFCALMAEFSTTDGCNMCTTDVWVTQPFQRQCSTNNNNFSTCNLSDVRVNCLAEAPPSPPLSPPSTTATASFGENSAEISDIFLGGSLSTNIKWREEIAVPLIKKHGLSYYNPAIREKENDGNQSSSDVLEWKKAMDRSKVLLMYVTDDTRSMTTIILAAYFIGLHRNVVLCVQNLASEGCVIENETLSLNALKDYNRARVYLKDLATRKQVPVFENITEAVECAIERSKSR